jgi:hypothetical protein
MFRGQRFTTSLQPVSGVLYKIHNEKTDKTKEALTTGFF